MAVFFDRAAMTVSGTPGTGPITLGSAYYKHQTFAAAGVTNGVQVAYSIEDGANWETGLGTYSSTGPTLTRTTIRFSSNANAAINVSSSAVVYSTFTAEDIPGGSTLAVSAGGTGLTALGTGVQTALGNATNGASGIVTLDANQNASIAGTLAMSSSFLRNRLINPSFAIDQRNAGAAQTITAAAALAYTVDRWYAYCTGANVTGQRVTGAVANTYRYQFTGAASVTAIGFAQRIEALNSADLAGKTATFSVDLANSLLTTVTWTAYYANTADTFGTLASPTRTQIATGTFTVNSTVTRYSTNISIPAAATTGIEIVLTVGAQTSGTWTIGNAQLEEGSVATPVERRQYGQELALCQRYLPAFNSNGTTVTPIGIESDISTTQATCALPLKVTARVIPSGVTASSGSAITLHHSGANIATTGISFAAAGIDAAYILLTVASGLTAGQSGYIYLNSATAQLLFTGCEL